MPLGDESLDQVREALGDATLNEERSFSVALVQDRKHSVDVAHDALADRCVEVDTRLVPVFDVDGKRRERPAVVGSREGCWLKLESSRGQAVGGGTMERN